MSENTLEKKWAQLERNLGYYFSRVVGRPLCPPEHVYFSLTNRCNLKCKMCSIPSSGGRIEDELSFAQCRKIIDQIAGLGIDHVIFSGGEPALRHDIVELVRYAVSRRIKMVDLISNGLLITETMAHALIDAGLNHMTLSIDGQERANDFVRGAGAFKRAMDTMDLIDRVRGERKFPTLGINFTIMDCNIQDMVPMVEVARAKKCNIIVFQPMLSDNTEMQGREKNELWVSEKNLGKLREAIGRILELKRVPGDLTIHVNETVLELIPDYFAGTLSNKDLKCYEGFARIVIAFSGALWTCQGIYGELKTGALKKYWFSKRAAAIRRKVAHCRTYCLQSCVHMEELSDIYLEADELIRSVKDEKLCEGYLRRLLGVLGRYRFLVFKAKLLERFKHLTGKGDGFLREILEPEGTKLGESIRHFERLMPGHAKG